MNTFEILYHIEALKVIWSKHPNQCDKNVSDSIIDALWQMYLDKSKEEI